MAVAKKKSRKGKGSANPAARGSGASSPEMMSAGTAQSMMRGGKLPKGAAQMMRSQRSS